MGILKSITEWATSPWGQNVPIHIAWFLIWVAALAGLLFLIVHAIYVRYFAKAEEFADNVSPATATVLPKRIPRHSLAARLFHWIMAASMFTLLLTAFLPKIGLQFDPGDVRTAIEAIVGAGNRADPGRGIAQNLVDGGIVLRPGTQIEHAGDQLEAVFDPVIDLFDQDLLMLKRRLEIPLVALPLNRHTDDVGRTLQEGDVFLGKITL